MPIDYSKKSNTRPATPSAPPPPPVGGARPGGGVNLTKVTLTRSAPAVSLDKVGSTTGTMRVNLNWTAGGTTGIFGGRKGAVDLDLGCMYETTQGGVGVIQALGNAFGHLNQPPYIFLDGDDRSGNALGGENLHVNLTQLATFKRILVFAYIYEGAPNWAAARGVVTLFPPAGRQIEVQVDENAGGARFCAIVMLTNGGGELQISREVRYINGSQADVDAAYGFGMRWTRGRK